MKNFIRTDFAPITEQDYTEGRTLLQIKEMERDDYDNIIIPQNAKYMLSFALYRQNKSIAFYLDEEEFGRLACDDFQRITITAAMDAGKKTFKKQESTFTRFQVGLAKASQRYVAQMVAENLKLAASDYSRQRTF